MDLNIDVLKHVRYRLIESKLSERFNRKIRIGYINNSNEIVVIIPISYKKEEHFYFNDYRVEDGIKVNSICRALSAIIRKKMIL